MLVVVTGGSGSGKSALRRTESFLLESREGSILPPCRLLMKKVTAAFEDIAGCGQEKDLRQLRDTQSWMS